MDVREAELIYEAGKETVVKTLLKMDARIKALEEQALILTKKIASLSSNSTNSSKPPSSDGPRVSKLKKRKSGRSPGGRKGHKAHRRELVPIGDVEHIYEHYPDVCEKCADPLKESRSSPDAYVFSKNMLKELGHIFGCWHAFREGFITKPQLLDAMILMMARMKGYCLKYRRSPDGEVCTRAKRTLANWDHLFTFLTHEGVEPTNNAAERAVRPAAQWRKFCFGNQSDAGERFTERILTVTRTCQLQGKNPFDYLSNLMEAAFKGLPRPSLFH